MELRELVAGEVQKLTASASVGSAAAQMSESGVGALAVIDGDDVIGIFTERDLVKVVASSADPAAEQVNDWMTPYPDSVDADTGVDEAAQWMLAAGYRHLPVVDHTGLVGMASIKDILWGLTEEAG